MLRRFVLASVGSLILITGVACSRKEPQSPERDAASREEAPPEDEASSTKERASKATASALDIGAPPLVKTTVLGNEPRKALRIGFKKGSRTKLNLTGTTKLEAAVGPFVTTKSDLPPVTYEIQLETVDVEPNGKTRVDFEILSAEVVDKPDAKPALLEQSKTAALPLNDLKGSLSLDERGLIEDLVLLRPPQATGRTHQMIDQITRSLARLSVPFPKDAVGEGAQWTVRRVMQEGGVHFEQIATYELVRAKGSQVRVNVKIEREAPKQSYTPAGTTSGNAFTLEALEFSGSAEGEWDTTQPGLRSGKEVTTTTLKMMSSGKDPQLVLMKTEDELTMITK